MLVGRGEEWARILRLLREAGAGRSGALLLVGEAGIGKTALLAQARAAAEADGMLVLRARGMQSESAIPFAGLSELLAPLVDRVDSIPATQATALRGALALGEATAADRFAVPAGVLSLLAAAAEERRLLALVDDVQWLDESSLEALLFAGRRLGAEGIALLGALRGADVDGHPWLERLVVGPLGEADARALLARAQGDGLASPVADRLVDGTGGNPLALLEIPTLLTDAQLAGREPLASPLRPGAGIKRAFRRRVDRLPEDTRRALLVAAASERGGLDAILAGLAGIGLDAEALEPAEAAGLIRLERGRLDFRHPLLRSTAYYAASAIDRRIVHRALAGTAPPASAERAWHLASATVAPDEEVAAALEAAAFDARRRGAPGTAARDFARAAQLTPANEPRARRLLEAAGDAASIGEGEQALAYLAAAGDRGADPLLASELRRREANIRIRTALDRDAYHTLTAEADAARADDPLRAAAMYLESSVLHMSTGDMTALIESADRARELAEGRDPGLELLAVLVIGEAHLALGERAAGNELVRVAEPYLLGGDVLAAPAEVLGMAGHSSIWTEEFGRAEAILSRLVRTYREASAIVALIYPLARTRPPRPAARALEPGARRVGGVAHARRADRAVRPARVQPGDARARPRTARSRAGGARRDHHRARGHRPDAGARRADLRGGRARPPRAEPRAGHRGGRRARAARRARRAPEPRRACARAVAAGPDRGAGARRARGGRGRAARAAGGERRGDRRALDAGGGAALPRDPRRRRRRSAPRSRRRSRSTPSCRCRSSWPAPSSPTGSGCGAPRRGPRRASRCAPRWRRSSGSARRHGASGRSPSCARPARRPAGAARRRAHG